MTTRRPFTTGVVVAAVLVSACNSGDDESSPDDPSGPSAPSTVTTTGAGAPSTTGATTNVTEPPPPTKTEPATTTTTGPVPTTTGPAPPTSAVPAPAAQVVQLDVVDGTRAIEAGAGGTVGGAERVVATTLYLPEYDGAADPLIVLAHGFAGHPDKFTELAMAWSDAGFVVAVPKFPLSNDEVPEPQVGDLAQQGIDVDFVIDTLLERTASPSGPVSGRIDPTRIGLYGLSLGSLTIWGTLFQGCCRDRVAALIQSDGGFSGDQRELASLAIPVMIAHSDADPIFPVASIRDEYRRLRSPKYLMTLHGFAHAVVGENTPTAADEAYRQATTVFWQRHLGGDPTLAFPRSVRVGGVTTLESRT